MDPHRLGVDAKNVEPWCGGPTPVSPLPWVLQAWNDHAPPQGTVRGAETSPEATEEAKLVSHCAG